LSDLLKVQGSAPPLVAEAASAEGASLIKKETEVSYEGKLQIRCLTPIIPS
jgi:hypothetical protein